MERWNRSNPLLLRSIAVRKTGSDLLFNEECILPAQIFDLVRCQILPLHLLEILLELAYDVLSFDMISYLQICRYLANFECLPADGTELPALEPVHVRECAASLAPYNDVHGKGVISIPAIYKYRSL